MNKNVAGLDVVRFGAAFLVAIFHLFYRISQGGTPYRVSGGEFNFPYMVDVTWFGWVGVQIFFVLSGFVIAYSAHGATAASFFRSRFLRLVPGAFVCATITLSVVVAIGDGDIVSASARWLRSVLFFPFGPWIDGVYWTLAIEVSFYLFVFLCIATGREGRIHEYISVVGLVSVLYNASILLSVWPEAYERIIRSRTAQLLLLNHGCEFATGVLLWRSFFVRFSPLYAAVIAICAFGGVMEIYYQVALNAPEHLGKWYVPASVWALSVLAVILSVQLHRAGVVSAKAANGLRIIGIATYPLYLVHQLVGAVLVREFHALGLPAAAAVIAILAILVAGSITVSTFIEPAVRCVFARLLDAGGQLVPRDVAVRLSKH